MFGPKSLTYAFGTKEGFGEYRKQRENGVSKEVAFRRALAKAGYSVAVEKVDDFIGKNNLVDDWLDGQSGIVRKLDSNRVKSYNEEKLSIKEYARLQSAVMTNHPNEKGYIKQILDIQWLTNQRRIVMNLQSYLYTLDIRFHQMKS